MKISSWKLIFDTRFKGAFKVRDLESVHMFMKDCLINGQEYTVPDVDNSSMYYTLVKDSDGQVIFAHTEYGMFTPIFMQYDNIDRKIYKARKSINAFFFRRED